MHSKVRITSLFFFIFQVIAIWGVLGNAHGKPKDQVAAYVQDVIEEANIPGLSIVLVAEHEQTLLNFGVNNLEDARKVDSKTVYQIGGCSKAFTALLVAKLVNSNQLSLDDQVKKYLPWFTAKHENKQVNITIRQLLYQTSGFEWTDIKAFDQRNKTLMAIVEDVIRTPLRRLPGTQFEDADINYDVLALVIEEVTKVPFEKYLQDNLFDKLGMHQTSIGKKVDSARMADGHKIGFFKPQRYSAPFFEGNNASSNITSSAEDIGKWLQFQLGVRKELPHSLASMMHAKDTTVSPTGSVSYAGGWYVSLYGDGHVFHSGIKPDFTTFIGFVPGKNVGVGVLANSNSAYTEVIGCNILRLLTGNEIREDVVIEDSNDRFYTLSTCILGIYVLALFAYFIYFIIQVKKEQVILSAPKSIGLTKIVSYIILILPFSAGVYLLPSAITDLDWSLTFIWSPKSFVSLIIALSVAIILSCSVFFLSTFISEKNNYFKVLPRIFLLSLVSGFANLAVILLITSAFNVEVEIKYLIFYYILTFFAYISSRKYVEISLVKLTKGLIFNLRVRLINRIFDTPYQKFEKVDKGRVYTAMNEDVSTVGESANMAIQLITNVFTVVGAFLYLASIALWATLLSFLIIVVLALIYHLMGQNTNSYFEQARDSRTDFMRLISGMIDGFKELSLHDKRKKEYQNDLANSAEEFKDKTSIATIKFTIASLLGESVLIVIMGMVAFGFPVLFPDIKSSTLLSFIVILLFLIGPINAILDAIPSAIRLRIAWLRINQFTDDIPSNMERVNKPEINVPKTIEELRVNDLSFEYLVENQKQAFSVGPIDLEIKKGEILFIVGANGSGKTTLAKLICGLYEPCAGTVFIDNEEITPNVLGEYFSVVFSPQYLFEKLYDIDLEERSGEVDDYLKVLKLSKKVEIIEGTYSTVNLSGGQRKRLGLLQCYLENSPIYLFDEWAADQDPEYRSFFYRTLLPEMKKAGKIVIAITHDDHYFDVADKLMKMDDGKLFSLNNTNSDMGLINVR